MEAHTRACVAYVAGRLVSGQDASAILDHSESVQVKLSGTVRGTLVDVLDHARDCRVQGLGDGKNFNLLDRGESHQIELTVKGIRFEGFDHGSQSHFFGEVHRTDVSLFDVGDSGYFHFSLC